MNNRNSNIDAFDKNTMIKGNNNTKDMVLLLKHQKLYRNNWQSNAKAVV